ncbi:DUF3644 domain-containing protein [Candidatus Wolfebacteria bacterium]|nr:DUF3644 domain-containing protein [Candidatus Wolfebacteria bacterium]
MKSRHQILLDNSISATLAGIEIYNKPIFSNREASFCFQIVNAWELLLKAKILKNNRNQLKHIYKYEGRFIKRNRSSNPMTIGIYEAFGKIRNLDTRIKSNLEELIAIRDAATHFYYKSKALPYLVFTLGTAALRNYEKCCRDWFSTNLDKYNFYILPIGFGYTFQTFSKLTTRDETEEIANIMRSVSKKQSRLKSASPTDFQFICEIKIQTVSVKKAKDADIVASIDSSGADAQFIEREVNKLDKYPYTFRQILAEAKKQKNIKPNKLSSFIRERNIKDNPAYHDYTYRSKKHESENKPSSDIYNYAFLQLVINDPYFKS